MANNIMTIDHLTNRTRTWKAQLRVVEKQAPHTPKSSTTIQQLILVDTKVHFLYYKEIGLLKIQFYIQIFPYSLCNYSISGL